MVADTVRRRAREIPGLPGGVVPQTRVGARVGAGPALAACVTLSVLAFGARSLTWLVVLTAVDLLLAGLLCSRGSSLWRDAAKLIVWQTVIIVGLYLLRFGLDGWWPGTRTSWQLFLAFLPGMVLLRSMPQSSLTRTLDRLMPYRVAFVLTASMRFIPLILSEVVSIHEVQMLRGARVLPRDMIRPWNWPDLVRCVLVPAIIQSLALAAQIADAAHARDFGARERRTYWPGP